MTPWIVALVAVLWVAVSVGAALYLGSIVSDYKRRTEQARYNAERILEDEV